jgi:hypothetical protein
VDVFGKFPLLLSELVVRQEQLGGVDDTGNRSAKFMRDLLAVSIA